MPEPGGSGCWSHGRRCDVSCSGAVGSPRCAACRNCLSPALWGGCARSLTLQLCPLLVPSVPGLLWGLCASWGHRVVLEALNPHSSMGWAPEGGAGTPVHRLCPLLGAERWDRRWEGAVLVPVPPFTFSLLLPSLISLHLWFYGSL